VHLLPCAVADDNNAAERVSRVRVAFHRRHVQTEDPYPILLGTPDTMPNARALAARLVLVPCYAALARHGLDAVADAVEGVGEEMSSVRSTG
jgi:dTDP-4-amino-4,6-dideoxygalactose transaminase